MKDIKSVSYTHLPVTYTVRYDWGTDSPTNETLPQNSNSYSSEQPAKADVDTNYTSTTSIRGQKDGDIVIRSGNCALSASAFPRFLCTERTIFPVNSGAEQSPRTIKANEFFHFYDNIPFDQVSNKYCYLLL